MASVGAAPSAVGAARPAGGARLVVIVPATTIASVASVASRRSHSATCSRVNDGGCVVGVGVTGGAGAGMDADEGAALGDEGVASRVGGVAFDMGAGTWARTERA